MSAHRPRRRFGQHFLTDRSVVERIVAAIAPRPGDVVVEIGPGRGALTGPLAERVDHLHVIEIDRDLARALAERFPAERVTVHVGDALAFDYAGLPQPMRLVGNLPYNISTPLLFGLIPYAARIRDAHFMLQLEVVERMVAPPSTAEYGRLSVMLQYRFAMERLLRVPPGAFHPPPKVDSAVVRMIPRPPDALAARDPAALATVVTAAFTKRRKTLRNALAGIAGVDELARLGIDARLRPENLAVADYVALANAVAARGAAPGG
ncbi:MAG: 16S rRNA (adenine(1518)-N(6)/adenine(1519)-N(6))-dimethyltransferase RsmA [Burkholderiales bacterium]|nr:16S rRNA (adenine(1518)-N(6)/adenine(1519)-N(6))-dimethyltransferase RsmA [Burkholderiales bacterium]